MVSQDEWFAIHTSSSGNGSLTKSAGPRSVGGGFSVDPEAAPAIKAAFEDAIAEMHIARRAMTDMQFLGGARVNPVVDKYAAAMARVGYGDEGSVVTAAESAIAEYQNVIEQLDRLIADYEDSDEQATALQKRVRS